MFEISIIIASVILLIGLIIWVVRDIKNVNKINKRLDEIQKDYREIKERINNNE